MSDRLAHAHTAHPDGPNKCSTPTHDFSVHYRNDGSLLINKRDRATGADQFVVINAANHPAANTELQLPVLDDAHNGPGIGRDGQGFLHVMANMHVSKLNYIRSSAPDSITSWTVPARPPGGYVRYTYPTFTHLPDGTLLLYMRVGRQPTGLTGTAFSDSVYWRLPPTAGATWQGPTLIFQGVDIPPHGSDDQGDNDWNWSAYQYNLVTADGRLHMAWGWRWWNYLIDPATGLPYPDDHPISLARDRSFRDLAYAYNDANADPTQWKAVDGTACVLPFHNGYPVGPPDVNATINGKTGVFPPGTPNNFPALAANNPATACGVVHPTGYIEDGYINNPGLTIDDDGHPHIVISTLPWCHIWWDGGTWQQEVLAGNNALLAGEQLASTQIPYWFKGQLWILGTVAFPYRRMALTAANGTSSIPVGRTPVPANGLTPPPGANWNIAIWRPRADPDAYLRDGVIEVLDPDGDFPRYRSIGWGPNVFEEGTGPDPDPVDPRPVYTVPDTIDRTGATDVSAALLSWIQSIPTSGIIAAFPEGDYRVDDGLRIRRRENTKYLGLGLGARFIVGTPGDRTRCNLWFDLTVDIEVENLHTKGANPTGAFVVSKEAQHGFQIISCQGLTMTDCSATESHGDAFYIGGSVVDLAEFPAGCTDITVTNFRGTKIGRQGCAVTWADGVEIGHSSWDDVARSLLDLEPLGSNSSVHNVEFHHIEAREYPNNLVAALGFNEIDDIYIHDINVSGPGTHLGFRVYDQRNDPVGQGGTAGGPWYRHNWRIEDCNGTAGLGTPHFAAMQFAFVDGIDVHRCDQKMNPNRNMYMAQIDQCLDVSITDNTGENMVGQYYDVATGP